MAADGSVVLEFDMDVSEADKKLAKLREKIESLEKAIQKDTGKRDGLVKQSAEVAANLDAAKRTLYEMQKAPKGTFSREEIADQRTMVNGIQKEYNRIENAIDRYNRKIEESNASLQDMQNEAGELQQYIDAAAKSSSGMGDALGLAGKQLEKFGNRVKKLASRVFVFTLITTALRGLRTWLGKTVKSNDEASAAIAKLKGALLTLAQPLVSVIIPAFTALVNVLSQIVGAIASGFAAIFGSSLEESSQAAENLYDEQNALEGVGAAADEAQKSLAGFDEINKLSGDNAGAAGGGMETEAERPDFVGFITDELDKIATVVGAALLAIGAILAFSGANIPLGIALMAAGAITLARVIATNWDSLVNMLRGPLGIITALLSAALLVMGAILTFSGANIPLGLGLMVAGAIGLAASLAANWDTISALLRGPIGVVTALISAALLVIGAIILFSGANVPLGIGLMTVGAIGLATVIAANWDTVVNALRGPIGLITGILSAAALVLGAIFTFTGANIPLGIGLMIIGASGLATSMAVNWDTIHNALQGPIGTITAMVSIAFLVLGAILTFSGAAIGLGIGLIAVGAIGLATSIAANWDTITGVLGGTFNSIIALVSTALLVLGVVLIFTGAAIPLGLGMLFAGAAGMASSIAPNWDFILDKIKGAWENVKNYWNTNIAKFFTAEYWSNLASDMLNGLFGTLNSGSVTSGMGAVAAKVVNGYKDELGIHSPSTVFEGLGENTMQGLYIGVNSKLDIVLGVFKLLFTNTKNMCHATSEDLIETFRLMFNSIAGLCKQNITLMRDYLIEFMEYLEQEYTSRWNSLWSNFYSVSYKNIQKMIQAINQLIKTLNAIERNIEIQIKYVYEDEDNRTVTKTPPTGNSAVTVPAAAYSFPPDFRLGPIPALAAGAVIPPNREFIARLGDQSSGYNVEAPAALIKQMVTEALQEMGMGGGRQEAVMVVDGEVFGRLAYTLGNRESSRMGVSLVKGTV